MPMNAYFRPRLKVDKMKPLDFFHLKPPVNSQPLFPTLSVWAVIMLPDGRWIFPTIQEPPPGSFTIQHLGLDFDGTMVSMIVNGIEAGKTFISCPALTKKGKIKKRSVH